MVLLSSMQVTPKPVHAVGSWTQQPPCSAWVWVAVCADSSGSFTMHAVVMHSGSERRAGMNDARRLDVRLRDLVPTVSDFITTPCEIRIGSEALHTYFAACLRRRLSQQHAGHRGAPANCSGSIRQSSSARVCSRRVRFHLCIGLFCSDASAPNSAVFSVFRVIPESQANSGCYRARVKISTPRVALQVLFEEHARHDAGGWHGGIVAKRGAPREPGPAVHPDRSELAVAGLEAKSREAGVASDRLDPCEQRVRDAAAARRRSNVHALDLCQVREQRDARAPHGSAVDACDEELDVGLKDRVDREPVALLRRILGGEGVLELGDQAADG